MEQIVLTAGEMAMIEAKRAEEAAAKAKREAAQKIEDEKRVCAEEDKYKKCLHNALTQNAKTVEFYTALQALNPDYYLIHEPNKTVYEAYRFAEKENGSTDYDNKIVLQRFEAVYELFHITREKIKIEVTERIVFKNGGTRYSSYPESRGWQMLIAKDCKERWYSKATSVHKFIEEEIAAKKAAEARVKKESSMLELSYSYAMQEYPTAVAFEKKEESVWHQSGAFGKSYCSIERFTLVTFPNGLKLKIYASTTLNEEVRYNTVVTNISGLDYDSYIAALINVPKKSS